MSSFDKMRAALKVALESPAAEGSLDVIRSVLSSRHAYLVSLVAPRAAEIAPEELIPMLAPAFHRFMGPKAPKKDPQCKAKTAIAKALTDLGRPEEKVFLVGTTHVQKEPVYGGQKDTAGPLRGVCAAGLAASNHPDVMLVCADLLNDPELAARIGAARAVGFAGRLDGVPLLRLKANIGDDATEVISECFESLIALDPEDSIEFVSRFLSHEHGESLQEAAALALGSSNLDGCLDVLSNWLDERGLTTAVREVGYLAIALLRSEAAWAHLLQVIEDGSFDDGQLAVRALASFSHDKELAARVRDAAGLRLRDEVDLHF